MKERIFDDWIQFMDVDAIIPVLSIVYTHAYDTG